MSFPLVSIIMSVHNGMPFLHEAIDSILSQTIQAFEFIIIDDGSTDLTPTVLERYQSLDRRVRVIKLEENLGLPTCLNIGIDQSKGKYIARMDADDISLPYRLEEQVKFLEDHPDIDMAGTGYIVIDDFGKNKGAYLVSADPAVIKWSFIFSNPIAHPSVMIRTSTLKKNGGYDEQCLRSQDYDLWWRISLDGRISNVQKVCLLFRRHENRVSVRHSEQQQSYARNISRKYLSSALGREISLDVVDAINGKRTTALSAIVAGNTIRDYCEYCMKDETPAVQLVILWQAAKKIFLRLSRHILSPIAVQVWFHLFLLSTNIFVVIIKTLVSYAKLVFCVRSEA